MKFRLGDTLIEVTLAVGIFSMVAVAVVAVVSGSTSSAQTALETTITREEIDAQAEAIRFIQASYIAGGETNAAGNDRYVNLWHAITKQAKNRSESLAYNPVTCDELYAGENLIDQGAFIINTHNLNAENVSEIVVVPTTGSANKFFPATTYPRIIYNSSLDDDSVYGQSAGTEIARAEGLFVVAVRDNDSTHIVTASGAITTAAYYDFYIRTCWFGPGADRPSTISTVIRLYDPETIGY